MQTVYIPTQEDGVKLQLLVAKPASAGPYPTVVFNHGSTGRGHNPSLYKRAQSPAVIQKYFNDKGWAGVFPQRRGRGKSGGQYLEGMRDDGGGYSCDIPVALAGFERATQDLDAVMAYLRQSPEVQVKRILVAGASRGGILSIAYAGMRPSYFIGAINFVGGWLGGLCPTHEHINPMIFEKGAGFGRPTLWLHGSKDQYYKIAHCRENFQKFVSAGGQGSFLAVRGGHAFFFKPELWTATVDQYLQLITKND